LGSISIAFLIVIGFRVVVVLPADAALQPAPTRVPPTLVPTLLPSSSDALANESTLARIRRDDKVRVGLLFNAPQFSQMNIRGEVEGFEADLARLMAETWEVTFEPLQVTRQNALDMLKSGAVDMLLASQVHRRDLDPLVEFSQTYYWGSQSMMVRPDDVAARLSDMANRRIGYVLGTASAEAISLWQQRAGIGITLQSYLTLDQSLVALVNNEVDGVVDSRANLLRLLVQPVARILDEPVGPEPYAVVIRRQDVNFRSLVNKTIQYLAQKGRIQELYKTYLTGTIYPLNALFIWGGIGESAPKPDQFADVMDYPARYTLPQIQQTGVVRVAGLRDLPSDATESERRFDTFNRQLIEAVVSRWEMRVEYVPNSSDNAADLVASGQADIAVGLPLDWALSDRVDLTHPYLLHGERLLVKKDSPYETFLDLRARIVAVFASEAGAADRVNEIARSVNSGVRIFIINREQDLADVLLIENNADAAFGDSLKLIPHVEANPDTLRITIRGDNPDPFYSRAYSTFGVARNDLDFRLLVEYTLQELSRNGILASLSVPVMLPQDIPPVETWPGVSDYLGFRLS
jgi:ABC-type amino acid transport substrate-binding protein